MYRRSDSTKLSTDEIKNKSMFPISMDEIQIASMRQQSIYKSCRDSNLLDKQKLYEMYVKMSEYSDMI